MADYQSSTVSRIRPFLDMPTLTSLHFQQTTNLFEYNWLLFIYFSVSSNYAIVVGALRAAVHEYAAVVCTYSSILLLPSLLYVKLV